MHFNVNVYSLEIKPISLCCYCFALYQCYYCHEQFSIDFQYRGWANLFFFFSFFLTAYLTDVIDSGASSCPQQTKGKNASPTSLSQSRRESNKQENTDDIRHLFLLVIQAAKGRQQQKEQSSTFYWMVWRIIYDNSPFFPQLGDAFGMQPDIQQ